MKNNNEEIIKFTLNITEEELSLLASTLQYCLSVDKDFMCCPDCRGVGSELFEKLIDVFKKNHKHI